MLQERHGASYIASPTSELPQYQPIGSDILLQDRQDYTFTEQQWSVARAFDAEELEKARLRAERFTLALSELRYLFATDQINTGSGDELTDGSIFAVSRETWLPAEALDLMAKKFIEVRGNRRWLFVFRSHIENIVSQTSGSKLHGLPALCGVLPQDIEVTSNHIEKKGVKKPIVRHAIFVWLSRRYSGSMPGSFPRQELLAEIKKAGIRGSPTSLHLAIRDLLRDKKNSK